MPNTKSAKKALRSSLRKREINSKYKWTLKSVLKDFRKSLKDSQESAFENLSKVYSALDKSVKKNIIHKANASRKKSRLYSTVVKTFDIQKDEAPKKAKAKAPAKKAVKAEKAEPKAKAAPAKKTSAKKPATKKSTSTAKK